MRNLLFTLTFILLVGALFAQQPNVLKGKVVGQGRETIESATISLLSARDSATVKLALSDKSGNFLFENLQPGRYVVCISAIGFSEAYSPVFEITSSTLDKTLEVFTLQPLSKSMDAVIIRAKRPLVEQKIDRTIINVEASVTNVGSTAMEVLEKSPGISVDKDGNISLKGKEGVMILIDGRPTHLSNADLANMLRGMNASELDQLEIMTNPPAKYDAAGNAGIINIKTKKNKAFGYNASITLGYGQGFFPKHNQGINFNYRKGKINLFTNINHNYNKRFEDLDIQRKFRDKTSKELISHFDQEARMKSENTYVGGKLGLDYAPSKSTTIGLVFSGGTRPQVYENRNLNNIYNAANNLIEQTRAYSHQENDYNNYSVNLNFRKLLDSAGKELTADADYLYYDILTDQTLSNYYFNPQGLPSRKSDTLFGLLPQEIKIYSGKVDYLHPLKNNARFEAGIKSSFVKTDNNAVYDTIHNGLVIRDLNRSNYFIYEENIYAAYANVSGPLSEKLNGQLGLRMENTVAKGNQVTTGENFKRSYTQLFPTAYLQYKASDKHSFVLNYGRRIRRPHYQSMNPFIEYLDRYTYQQGNPNLKPQFSHNIELSHTLNNFLTSTLNFSQTNDILLQVIEQNEETNETYIKQSNIARQKQYGLSVNAGFPLTKWWRSNLYVNGFYNKFDGIVNNEPVSIDAVTLMFNGSMQFTLAKNTAAEVSGWFRTAGLEGVIKAKAMGMMSFGISHQVLDGKGSIRLNIRDIFYTQRFQASTKYGSVDAAFQNRSDSRVFNIGFTYRFSKGTMNGNQKKRSQGSANEELNRVGG